MAHPMISSQQKPLDIGNGDMRPVKIFMGLFGGRRGADVPVTDGLQVHVGIIRPPVRISRWPESLYSLFRRAMAWRIFCRITQAVL